MLSYKLTARHPLVRFIVRMREEFERSAPLSVDCTGGECRIVETDHYTLVEGCPPFKSSSEARDFIYRAGTVASEVVRRKVMRERSGKI